MLGLTLSALPLVWLVVALTLLRMPAWKAAIVAFVIAVAGAFAGFGDSVTVAKLAGAAGSGIRFALCPIAFVIIAALFTYRVCKRSGAMLVIRATLANVSSDARVMTLLIAWGFGNFMEGIAGFGTSVAIPAAIMAGVGLDPVRSVICCLICNATSTAYGSVGVPTLALAKSAGLDLMEISFSGFFVMAAAFLVTPFLLTAAACGWRALKGTWWLCLAAAVSFVTPCLLAARFLGPELPDVIGAICSMVTVVLLARFVKEEEKYSTQSNFAERRISGLHLLHAACPFLLVVAFLAFYALLMPSVKEYLTPGLVILVAASFGAFIQGLDLRAQWDAFRTVVYKNRRTLATIVAILMTARVMDACGMISCLAAALVKATGGAYAYIAPLPGVLGGFMTGSGTSSNIIFGPLQRDAALALHVRESIFAAANMFGGGIGKMLAPASVLIGLSAVERPDCTSEVMRRVLGWFAAMTALACLSCGLLVELKSCFM